MLLFLETFVAFSSKSTVEAYSLGAECDNESLSKVWCFELLVIGGV